MFRALGTVCCLAIGLVAVSPADAALITVAVSATSGPWDFNSTLNSAYSYGPHDFTPPTIITAASGFDFSPGRQFTITYLSGLTTPYVFYPFPFADGTGDGGTYGYLNYDASNNPGSTFLYFPSRYVDSSSYPVYLNALIGTFTDSAGAIVGTPFYVGNGATVLAPFGASQLQLGINDDTFRDNRGSLNVSVQQDPAQVPEPSSLALFGLGSLGAAAAARRRRNQRLQDAASGSPSA